MYCPANFICGKASDGIHIVSHQVVGGDVFRNSLKPEKERQDIKVVISDSMKDSMIIFE